MQGNLFRQEALEHQKDKLHGEVLLIPSVKTWVISGFLTIWVILVGVWLSTSQFARQETVRGWLEPDLGMLKIYPENTIGKVKQILVQEGQQVTLDQPLMIINGDRVLANGQHLEDQLLAEYQHQQTLLEQQLGRTDSIFRLRRNDIEQQITSIETDISHIDTQLSISQQRHVLVKSRLDNVRAMHLSGHVSQSDFEQVVERELALQSEIKELNRNRQNQLNQKQQLQIRMALLPNEQNNQKEQLQASLSDLAQKIAQIHGQRAYVVKATQAGVVSNIQIREGEYTQQSTPLMTLIPDSAVLIAKLLVPVRASGFIEEEQLIEVRYDAYPYQKFGIYEGRVTHIARSPLLPNEIHFLPFDIREPVFQVTAELELENVSAYGESVALKPGMTFSADVKLSERTVLEWLLEPIYSIKGKL